MNRGPTKYTQTGGTRDDHWRELAVCLDEDPDAFFPEPPPGIAGVGQREEDEAEAKAICANCPVQVDCLRYALANDERFGVWGGFTEAERRAIQRRNRRNATA